MGALAERAGLSQALFKAADAVIGNRRGGVAMAAIGACTAFGAICGSSVATTATMGRAALPELRRCGYDEALATGTLAVGGTLGILIPPSIILVDLRDLDRAEHRQAVHGGPGPGPAGGRVLSRRDRLAGAPQSGGRAGRAEAVAAPSGGAALVKAWPVLLIAVAVVGGIYGGVFTPTEGAAVGRGHGPRRSGCATRTLGPPPSPRACARPRRPRR